MKKPSLSTSAQPTSNHRAIMRRGIKDSIGVPGISIFASMIGFSALAREAGFDVVQTSATSGLVWGMPGQVAMASLHMAGASLLVIFTAVALANMRMMLMVMSGMDMLGLREVKISFVKKFLLMHMLAITSWVQIGKIQPDYTPPELLAYFKGNAGMIYLFGMLGTFLGYYLSELISQEALRAVIVITPLYILLMVINARVKDHRMAAILGGALCPLSYPFLGEWSILFAGIVGGSLVVAIRHGLSKQGFFDRGLGNDKS